MLRPPIDLLLAAPARTLPGAQAMRGGSVNEPRWDGFRGAVFVIEDRVVLQSRSGGDLSKAFPELLTACRAHLPVGALSAAR